MARSSTFGAAVEDELDGKVNVVPLGFASDLDAIGKTAQGAMGPTAATVLRNVLLFVHNTIIEIRKARMSETNTS